MDVQLIIPPPTASESGASRLGGRDTRVPRGWWGNNTRLGAALSGIVEPSIQSCAPAREEEEEEEGGENPYSAITQIKESGLGALLGCLGTHGRGVCVCIVCPTAAIADTRSVDMLQHCGKQTAVTSGVETIGSDVVVSHRKFVVTRPTQTSVFNQFHFIPLDNLTKSCVKDFMSTPASVVVCDSASVPAFPYPSRSRLHTFEVVQ